MESEEEEEVIYHGCPAQVWNHSLSSEHRNCRIAPADGDKLCPVHRRQFTRNPGAEAFQDFSAELKELLIALDNGTQVRLYPSRKKSSKIRSWIFQLQMKLQSEESWELNSFTDSFNQDYNVSFTPRQISQGLKVLVDRGSVSRSRKLCKGERLTLYQVKL
jgi:kynureninase